MVLLESGLPPVTAPLFVSKGGNGAGASPVRSSSRGWVEHPREESAPEAPLTQEVPASGSGAEVQEAQELPASQAMVTTTPLPPSVPLLPGSPSSSAFLERALSEMTQLQEDLLGADLCLVASRLELVSGWLHSNMAV
mgnify:CR=1 FL=1